MCAFIAVSNIGVDCKVKVQAHFSAKVRLSYDLKKSKVFLEVRRKITACVLKCCIKQIEGGKAQEIKAC